MSGGFCLLLELGGCAADRRLLEAMAGALRHRAPDGADQHVDGPLADACQHFWTVPEDVDSQQPLRHPDGRRLWLYDGRIDNRDELISALGLRGADRLSDAALALRAYERWEDGAWGRLIGPFVAAVCEPAASRVTLVRDPIGDRSLFFHLSSARLIAASEEQAVLAGGRLEPRLDLAHAARHLGIVEPAEGSTFFAGVRELLPGHRLSAGPRGVQRDRWWAADPRPRLEGSDDELAERFRELLSRAVTARLRSSTPAVMQLSGGLDSSSIAALAAAGGRPLPALTWTFDELESCDERRFIEPLVARYGIESVHLASDEQHAFRDLDAWPRNPNVPEETVFRPLVETMYSAAAQRRSRVMLTGLYGDNLFLGGGAWWLDLVRAGRWREALSSAADQVRENGLTRFLKRRVLALPRWQRRRMERRFRAPDWLTRSAQRLVNGDQTWPRWLADTQRPAQHLRALSLMNCRATIGEQYHLRRHRLDLRNPFRDRRLVEFMLAVPAYQLERGARSKEILRRAMSGLLPKEILGRTDKTSLYALFRRGLEASGRRDLWQRLVATESWWGILVNSRWLRQVLTKADDSTRTLVLHRCLFLGRWAEQVRLAPTAGIT